MANKACLDVGAASLHLFPIPETFTCLQLGPSRFCRPRPCFSKLTLTFLPLLSLELKSPIPPYILSKGPSSASLVS